MTNVAGLLTALRISLDQEIEKTAGDDDHARGYRSGLRAARICVLDEQTRHVGLGGLIDRYPSHSTRRTRARHALSRIRRHLEEKRSAVDLELVRGQGFQDAMAYALAKVAQAAAPFKPDSVPVTQLEVDPSPDPEVPGGGETVDGDGETVDGQEVDAEVVEDEVEAKSGAKSSGSS